MAVEYEYGIPYWNYDRAYGHHGLNWIRFSTLEAAEAWRQEPDEPEVPFWEDHAGFPIFRRVKATKWQKFQDGIDTEELDE